MVDSVAVLDANGTPRTVATNDAVIAKLAEILAKLIAAPATEAKQDTLIAKDFATQTTLAAILAKIIAAPATEAKQDAAAALLATVGTRAYATGERVSVGAASAQSSAIAATEVLLHATVRCFVLAGAAPTAANTTSIPLEPGEKFHMRITSGHKIAVIRDTADGFLNINPVA